MFNFLGTKKDKNLNNPSNSNNLKRSPINPVNLTDDVEMHVMPEKFESSGKEKGEGKNKKTMLIIIVFVFCILIIGLSFYIFKDKILNLNNNFIPNNQPIAAVNDNRDNSETNVKISTSTEPVISTSTEPVISTSTEPVVSTSTEPVVATSTEPVVATSTEPVIATSTEPVIATNTPQILDADKDGLTKLEEGIFMSEEFNADTDGDGYLDGIEVGNLYSPVSYAPGKLKDGQTAGVYTEHRYGVLYPKAWTSEVQEEGKILFKAQNGEFIELMISPNLDGISLSEWYKSQAGSAATNSENIETVNNKSLLNGMKIDEDTVYLNDYNYIYVLKYNWASSSARNYSAVFEMMWQSFESKIDTDGDGVTDHLEIDIYHTNPKAVNNK